MRTTLSRSVLAAVLVLPMALGGVPGVCELAGASAVHGEHARW